MTAKFSEVVLEHIQNYALALERPEGTFLTHFVEHWIGEAVKNGTIDQSLEAFAEVHGYGDMDMKDFKRMLRQWRSQGMSNADILKELGQRDSDKNNEE